MTVTDRVQVWLARVDAGNLDDDARAALSADLDARALAKVARMRRAQDRDRGLAAHALLRRTIGGQLGVVPASLTMRTYCPSCGSADHGKPYLSGFGDQPPLRFNVSHSGGLVAVAIAPPGIEVGVDVESTSRAVDWAALRKSIFTDQEWAATGASADPARARTDCWSRKEAVVKATGYGLSTPLRSVVIERASEPASEPAGEPAGEPAAGRPAAGAAPPWMARIRTQPERSVAGWDVGELAALGQAADLVPGYAAAVAVDPTVGELPITPTVLSADL